MSKAAELAKMGEVLTNSQIGGRRNIVINGAFQIAQRGTSFTGVSNGDNGYYLDRFKFAESGTSGATYTITQATDGPSGFGNSMKFDCTTADTSLGADEQLRIISDYEGLDLQQLKKGTSDAEKVTLSFYVKSNLTGTAIVTIYDTPNSRHISKSYTIDSANTWERKILTFDGDTSGAIDNDNTTGFRIEWHLTAGANATSGTLATSWAGFTAANQAVGQTINLATSTDNNFFITGIQMEVGSQATSFEHRSFGEEEELCKRYFVKHKAVSPYDRFALGTNVTTDDAAFLFKFYPAMRGIPTLTIGTLSHLCVTDADGTNEAIDTAPVIDTAADSNLSVIVYCADITNNTLTAGDASFLAANNNVDAFLAFDSEL